MKIDIELVRNMVKAGATADVVLAYLETLERQNEPRKKKDRERKRAEICGNSRKVAETVVTIEETSRAKLFREGKSTLLTLGISKTRAGALITEWLSVTKDDEARILETIKTAQRLAVHDAPGWILAQLRGKTNGTSKNGLVELAFDLAEQARELERDAGINRQASDL